jgi:hypothetical protein
MPDIQHFDAVFLGGGTAAKHFAPYLARSGKRTAVVERQWIGGSCLNVNCLPIKNEAWSAKVIELAPRRTIRRGNYAGLRRHAPCQVLGGEGFLRRLKDQWNSLLSYFLVSEMIAMRRRFLRVIRGPKRGQSTILDSLEPPFVWRVRLPSLVLLRAGACPVEICFPPFRLSKPSEQNYSQLDVWQWVCRQCLGVFAGQRPSLVGERICGGSLNHFLFRSVAHEVRVLVVRHPPSPSTSIFWVHTSIGV